MNIFLIEGAENTFALVSFLGKPDVKNFSAPAMDRFKLAELAKKICTHKDVLADGCVFVFPSQKLNFSWEFFNSDGSDALMCGNASRAVALWYSHYINESPNISYYTPGQIVDAVVLNSHTVNGLFQGQVRVYLNKAQYIGESTGHRIYDSGVPHLCVFIDENDLNFKNLVSEGKWDTSFESVSDLFLDKARELRFPSILNSKGANVTYIWKPLVSVIENGFKVDVRAMTFERGVENWTRACGTGAIAAAYYVNDILKIGFPVNIQMPGGILEINEFEGRTTLSGPAKILKEIHLEFDQGDLF